MLLRGKLLLLFAMVAGLGNGNAWAESLDINLGDEAFQAKYNSLTGGTTYGRTEFNVGVLYNEDKDITLGEMALMVIDAAGSKAPGLEIGVGPKVFFTEVESLDALAIALGGSLRYKAGPQSRWFVRGRLFYAPSVTSFADIDSMGEAAVEVGFELLPTADVYAGFRRIEADFDVGGDNDEIDESGYFGMKIAF